MAGLTKRELQVLQLVAKGWTNAQIAAELKISKRTVAFHMENVLAKLGASNRAQAVAEAMRRGWLEV